MTVTVETLPIPHECRSALLYGGAFDPPHRAHLELPPLARAAIGCELLVYIPAAAAPLKDGPVASDANRLAMLRVGLEGTPHTSIATLELDRAGASYTVDTLREIRDQRPDTALRFLIGADQARQFHRWREHEAILDLAEPAVMLRPPLDAPGALLSEMAAHWSADELSAWRARFIELPPIDASSTRIRELLGARERRDEFETLLTPPVLGYIEENALYTGRA